MNISLPGWDWYSQRGLMRDENRDACGIFQSEKYTFSIIVDASSKGERGVHFNFTWINRVLQALDPYTPSPQRVADLMHDAQRLLRYDGFIHERACYAALLLPHNCDRAFALTCGDCQIGYQAQRDPIDWLTKKQTLESFCEDVGVACPRSGRQIVTRTLNAKRFERPEVIELIKPMSGVWILATDGYCSEPTLGVELTQDDSSLLRIGYASTGKVLSDSSNLLVRALDTSDCKAEKRS